MSLAGSDFIFWLAVALVAVAQLFILKAVLFPGALPVGGPAEAGRAAGRLRPASRPLEIAWVVLPAVILVWLFMWAWDLRHPEALAPRSVATTTTATTTASVECSS